MFIKIVTSLIMLFVVFMGFKQGVAMVGGKPEAIAVFERANLNPFLQMLFWCVYYDQRRSCAVPATLHFG